MGIMIAKKPDEVLRLNRKKRNKMSTIKDGAKVREVIIQEGIHTEENIDGAVTEPVIYMIDHFVIGGFYSCLLYTSPSPRDNGRSRMPSSA